MCVDVWQTPMGDKWIDFCRILRSTGSGMDKLDASRFEDVTSNGENEDVLATQVGRATILIK